MPGRKSHAPCHEVLAIVIPLVVIPYPALAASPGKPKAVRACSLLSKAEVKRIAKPKDPFFDMLAPSEEPIPGGGSGCHYSLIFIQIDPFTPAKLEELRKQAGAEWVAVAGIGDAAYQFDNKQGGAAELYARVGQRVFTVQIATPAAAPGEPAPSISSFHPATIALAKALVPKLR